jgi:hypothetical protein
LKSILEINGYDLRAVSPALVVASPPCQKYSHMAMPFSRGKREGSWQRWERDSTFGDFRLNELFNACFRIARQIGCPIVLENVKGAQPWLGRAKAHFGSYYLWGDVADVGGRVVRADVRPEFGQYARAAGRGKKRDGRNFHAFENGLGSSPSFNGAEHETRHVKVPGVQFSGYGKPGYKAQGFNVTAAQRYRNAVEQAGLSGPAWFNEGAAAVSSRSDSRKAASAMIAEIPFELASYIARAFKPA